MNRCFLTKVFICLFCFSWAGLAISDATLGEIRSGSIRYCTNSYRCYAPILGPGTLDTGSGHKQWEYRGQTGVGLNIDLLPYLKEGENEITIELAYTEGGKAWFDFATSSCSKEWVDVGGKCADYHSKVPEHQCTVTKPEFCSEGEETRFIAGHNFHNKCWNYKTDFTCYLGQTEDDDDCKAYQAGLCSLMGSECLEHWPDGTCKDKELSYSCSNGDGTEEDVLVCNTSFGGDVFDVSTDYEASGDFAKAISTLAMVDAMTEDLDIDDISVFEGEDYRCTTSSISTGGENCCPRASFNRITGAVEKDNVKYGSSTICGRGSADTRNGPHIAKGHCIDLGRYCDQKDLGVCYRYKRTYCCFGSTLARILQEQGKRQLGFNHGSNTSPDCRAFTADELERIDWSKLDLSDFYNEVMENFVGIDEEEATNKLGSGISTGDLEKRMQGLLPTPGLGAEQERFGGSMQNEN